MGIKIDVRVIGKITNTSSLGLFYVTSYIILVHTLGKNFYIIIQGVSGW